MKKIKVMFNGERLRDIYPHATRWQVIKWKVRNFFRKVLIASFALGVIYGSFEIGTNVSAQTVYTVSQPVQQVKEVPVLDRIAKCESPTGQLAKNGQVQLHANTNGTVDVGAYQINTTWGAKATSLGYDITTTDGNKKMAEWLYANIGTGPWSSSANCWNK